MSITFLFYSPIKAKDPIVAFGSNSSVCSAPSDIDFNFFTQIILLNEFLFHSLQLLILTPGINPQKKYWDIVSFRQYIMFKKIGFLNKVSLSQNNLPVNLMIKIQLLKLL